MGFFDMFKGRRAAPPVVDDEPPAVAHGWNAIEPVRDTPNGKLAFLLLVGVEDAVRMRALKEGSDEILGELRRGEPELVTRLPRVSRGAEK